MADGGLVSLLCGGIVVALVALALLLPSPQRDRQNVDEWDDGEGLPTAGRKVVK